MTADDSSAGASARRPTIQDVAAAAGVSRALVSIVLRGAPGASEATRLRVREVAQRLGYRPDRRAQQLRESRSRTVGVSFEVRQAFHGDLVETLYTAAADRGFSLLLSASARTRTEGDAVQTLLDDRPEALVLIGSRLGDDALRELRRRLPVVVLARTAAGVVDAVRTDDAEGARRGVGHLAELGHRRILHLDGGDAAGAAARRAGFLETAGPDARLLPGGVDEEAGARAATALLDNGEELPTAVFAFNDRCAFGVLDTFLRRGIRVPEDVSVLGFDDSLLSRLEVVGLSTIAQDPLGLARATLDRVVAAVDAAAAAPVEVVLEPALVVRRTTAAPRD